MKRDWKKVFVEAAVAKRWLISLSHSSSLRCRSFLFTVGMFSVQFEKRSLRSRKGRLNVECHDRQEIKRFFSQKSNVANP